MNFTSAEFWIALLQIIGVNIVLSGDNAVVIALAARGLPAQQQARAVAWGSGAAVVMRIVLTIVAVELLRMPYLKLVGAVLLLWIAVKLLIPGKESEGHGTASSSLASAVRTILLADLVMSLDNVIAVAAAAKGSTVLLIVGLAISIPLVVFASRLLLTLMDRVPVIITLGAALLGWVAGEMAVSDPVAKGWVDAQAALLYNAASAAVPVFLHYVASVAACDRCGSRRHVAGLTRRQCRPQGRAARCCGACAGPAAAHTAGGGWLRRRGTSRAPLDCPAPESAQAANSGRASAQRAAPGVGRCRGPSWPARRSTTITASAASKRWRRRARCSLRRSLSAHEHRRVGDPGPTIAEVAQAEDCDHIVMGARGLGTHTGALLGSVARSTVETCGRTGVAGKVTLPGKSKSDFSHRVLRQPLVRHAPFLVGQKLEPQHRA